MRKAVVPAHFGPETKELIVDTGSPADQITNGAAACAPTVDTPPETDVELNAAAAKLAETDAASFRSEGPRTDTKVTALLSLLAALIGTTGVLGTLATVYSRQAGAVAAAVLLSAAAIVLSIGFVLIVLVILPKLHHRKRYGGGPLGALVEVSELKTLDEARTYYRKVATDPLGHHAAAALLHAGLVVGRYRRIRRAGLVLIAGIILALAGGLAFSWGQ
ncbi:hypothetical protein JOF56_008950 [Kibdelosporangium banguiense]|uniref:Pycsar effector protein domain-containing protein n=1 Tax=Kibdelosporangium banguiense TaxID=1365924 RepID=A0ABS4TX77_9PSEU|nr:hypothetical protein [Kibdelosporangium banguiense]MBP2328565.1 hypothetical protein [Kibdelosporangium banguiense]